MDASPQGQSNGQCVPAPYLGDPWPASAYRDDQGVLNVGGVPVTHLAHTYGTPAYVVDEADLRSRARAYKQAFDQAFASIGTRVHLYYAGKALLTKAVATWVYEEGLRIDTASLGETAVALAAGVPGSALGLHGNNKSDQEIAQALDNGIGQIIIDSLEEIDRIAHAAAQRGVRAPVMVRVTTGVHAGGHSYIQTAHEDQKFGLSITADPQAPGGHSPAMQALLRVLDHQTSLTLLGVHCHIGSQILDSAGYERSARAVLTLRAQLAALTGYLMEEIDLGGGYGIAYLPGDQGLDPALVARNMALTIGQVCDSLATSVPRISVEPGRCISGPAGITLYTVGVVKPVTVPGQAQDQAPSQDQAHAQDPAQEDEPMTRLYVAVDGGMSDNIRPALYGARYHADLVGRVSTAPLVQARIVGKHCESGDILVQDIMLPSDIGPGDLLALAATGAYGRSMASNYNMLCKPPIIAVKEGNARAIVRRETIDDLLSTDCG